MIQHVCEAMVRDYCDVTQTSRAKAMAKAKSMSSYSPRAWAPSAPGCSGAQPIGGAAAVYMIGAGHLLCPATWMDLAPRGDHDCRELLKSVCRRVRDKEDRFSRCFLLLFCGVLCLSLMRSLWHLCGRDSGVRLSCRRPQVDATKFTATLCI
jgi:hypothetical protein